MDKGWGVWGAFVLWSSRFHVWCCDCEHDREFMLMMLLMLVTAIFATIVLRRLA